eukprot:CAMPEP_0115225100 /NCGR_PEP_ID=MMETSP0270-20121206/29924_1 /TAXON_ID=71861 /ORGANISM="Scrippsiella trochoidea, Strain CCMP3099" /LENGTH=84 /DNA_ID=CAMNT_0002639447 /DNA_START=342 /DNA_END=597 /DNA_ORIENTATION=-
MACQSLHALATMEFHNFAVQSPEVVTTICPSGENAAERSQSVCPCSVSSQSPVIMFQMRAVPSSEAVTTRKPPGSNAAEYTAPE